MTSCKLAQSRPALYFSQQLPSACNKGSTNTFVAQQVDHARWKTRNIDPKLAMKRCYSTRWRILYLISPPLLSCGSLAGQKFVTQLSLVLAFSGFWHLVFRRLKLDIGKWANFVTANERNAIKAIFTIFTSEFKTFDVVFNTWLQKSDVRKTWPFIFLISQIVFVWNGCSLALSKSYIEDITRWREDMNFMFEWQEQYQQHSERVRYRSCQENINRANV